VPPELVSRFDVAEIGKAARTPQGFLRVSAYLTRVGVFAYRRADGTTVRELRPEDEVFAAQSLASLNHAPVTDLHPTEMVSPTNVRKLSVGHVSADVRKDGHRVAGGVIVEDDAVIKAVERGDRREVSCGYRCRVDATPGVWNGQPYDCVQRDITYNHAALGPKNWGRTGNDIALRVDSQDGAAGVEQMFRLDDAADAVSELTTTAPGDRDDSDDGGDMDQVTLRVDGLDVLVPKQSGQVVEKGFKTRDDSIVALTKERDTLQGRADALTKELADVKVQLTAASDPKRLDSAVNERAALLEQARRTMPANHSFDGQTPRQIHEAVLKRLDEKIDLAGRSDEYVLARFDHAMTTVAPVQKGRNDSLDPARRALTGPQPLPERPRQDAKPPLVAWQQPLATSKDSRQ
jgi:hypothetical protein